MKLRLTIDPKAVAAIEQLRNADSVWLRLEELEAQAQQYLEDVTAAQKDAAQVVAEAFGLPRKAVLAKLPIGEQQRAAQTAFVALLAAQRVTFARVKLELPGIDAHNYALMVSTHNRWLLDPEQGAYRAAWQTICANAPKAI